MQTPANVINIGMQRELATQLCSKEGKFKATAILQS